MTDVAVDVSGEMDAPLDVKKKNDFRSFLQIATQIPDPKEWIAQQKQNVRPWLVFVQSSNFKPPASVPRLGRRIMRNVEYFQANYLFVFLGLVVYCLITSPLILIAICCSFYAGWKLNQRYAAGNKLTLFGKELTLAQQYGVVALCSMPLYYLVGAHGAMFWVIGASMVFITLHAAFYNIEALVPKAEDGFPLLEEV